MATFVSSYHTILNFDGTTYTAVTDSIAGEVTSFDNEPSGGGQPGSETFEQGDNMTTSGAISGGGQYVGFFGDGYIGNQGGTYYYFSNTPVNGGEVIPVDPDDFVVCFVEGTRILTPSGELPVESLRAGDLVVVLSATQRVQALRWVGHRRIDVSRARDRRTLAPILVRAGAIAPGVPFRDLRVSPEHAFLIQGRLVPAHLLVDGVEIVQEIWCRSVTYWHVELEQHGILVAEGAPAESYFDDGNRHFFDNPNILALGSPFQRRPGGRYAEQACAPPILDAADPALIAIRQARRRSA